MFGILRKVNKSDINRLELISLYLRGRVIKLSSSLIIKNWIKKIKDNYWLNVKNRVLMED